MEASKKKMKFPSAFSILFIILLIAIGLTWLIPSGTYSKLSYDNTENHFIVKTHEFPIKAIQQQNKPLINSISKFNFLISPTALSKSRLLSPIPINALNNTKKALPI